MDSLSATKNRSIVPLLLALCSFVALFVITYPYYKYYIDSDSVAYFTIARRYVAGDMRAINGLWSPFSPWLVALCIKNGMDELLAAHLVNAAACISIITATFFLFRRFAVDTFITIVLLLSLSVFLAYCQYEQLFDDLWQNAFLLFYLLLITSKSFFTKAWKWILCGVIAAVAYFAKTYSFYFIILHLAVTLVILCRKEQKPYKAVIKPFITVIVVMLLTMSPWLYLLHGKYGKWTISNAGAMNASWSLIGHKTFRPDIKYLIPPPYDNSPANIEDPSVSQGHLYSMFESPRLFALRIVRCGLAVVQGGHFINDISGLLLAVLLASMFVMFFRKQQLIFNTNHLILLWASLIMPAGYVLQHFEARYIWLLTYTGMILGATWIMYLKGYFDNKIAYYFATACFGLSFMIFPFFQMKTLFCKGEDIYVNAQKIKAMGLHGTFTSNDNPNWAPATALLTHMPYYTIEHFEIAPSDLLAEMRRYRINYYFFYCNPVDQAAIQLKDEQGNPFTDVTNNTIKGLKIYQVTP